MRRTVLAHLRAQWAGFLALFLVLAGGTALAATLPKNSVTSKTIKNSSLKSQDLKDGKAVGGADVIADQVQLRIGDSCPDGQAIRVINVSGAVICDSGGRPPTGSAGGALAGTYPDPTVANDAIDSAKIADGAITGADIGTHAVSQSNVDGTDHQSLFSVGGLSNGRCTTVTQAVGGARPGDAGILTTDGDMPDGQLIYLQRLRTDTADVKVCNLSGGSLPPLSVNVRILTFH